MRSPQGKSRRFVCEHIFLFLPVLHYFLNCFVKFSENQNRNGGGIFGGIFFGIGIGFGIFGTFFGFSLFFTSERRRRWRSCAAFLCFGIGFGGGIFGGGVPFLIYAAAFLCAFRSCASVAASASVAAFRIFAAVAVAFRTATRSSEARGVLSDYQCVTKKITVWFIYKTSK